MTPKISIVTPTYNQGSYIEETILSVLEQQYPNLEYIIIDGGSTDNTKEIIKKYEKYIHYWVSEKDSGMYEALQKGFQKSTGDIMAWINSDDMFHADAFSIVAEIFNMYEDIKWITGVPTLYDNFGRCVLVDRNILWSKYEYYLGNIRWIQQESTFWRRDLWIEAGSYINSNLKYAGDFDLWVRFFRYEKLYSVGALLGGFRSRPNNQLSKDYRYEYRREVDEVLKMEKLDLDTKRRLKLISFYKFLLNMTARVNIHSLKEKYFNLFGYPPRIIFDRERNSFNKEFTTYFSEL